MQQAPDCDMVLIHDVDLVTIDELRQGTVGGILIGSCIVLHMLAVTRKPRTRQVDGSPPEVQYRDT
jgi:hypothetical protein